MGEMAESVCGGGGRSGGDRPVFSSRKVHDSLHARAPQSTHGFANLHRILTELHRGLRSQHLLQERCRDNGQECWVSRERKICRYWARSELAIGRWTLREMQGNNEVESFLQ